MAKRLYGIYLKNKPIKIGEQVAVSEKQAVQLWWFREKKHGDPYAYADTRTTDYVAVQI